jgi:hypothetical protein
MTDTMIERMAKAIRKTRAPGSDRKAWSLHAARAALEAIREPTEGMLNPPGDGPIPFFDFHREDDARGIWQAMIDAALSEEARATVDAGSGPGTDNKTLTITHELGPDGEVREL